MTDETDVSGEPSDSGKNPSWWDRYAEEVLTKSMDGRGSTAIFGRYLTLRIVPPEIRTKHHKELFGGWGAAGKPLFDAYEEVGKTWDKAYRPGSNQNSSDLSPQQEVTSYMRVSDFEKVVTRQFPYASISSEDTCALLRHVRGGVGGQTGVRATIGSRRCFAKRLAVDADEFLGHNCQSE